MSQESKQILFDEIAAVTQREGIKKTMIRNAFTSLNVEKMEKDGSNLTAEDIIALQDIFGGRSSQNTSYQTIQSGSSTNFSINYDGDKTRFRIISEGQTPKNLQKIIFEEETDKAVEFFVYNDHVLNIYPIASASEGLSKGFSEMNAPFVILPKSYAKLKYNPETDLIECWRVNSAGDNSGGISSVTTDITLQGDGSESDPLGLSEDIKDEIAGIQTSVNNIQVGGRNYLNNSGNFRESGFNGGFADGIGGYLIDSTKTYLGKPTLKTTLGSGVSHEWIKLENDKEYTYSAMIYGEAEIVGSENTPLHFWAGYNNQNELKVQVIKFDQVVQANNWKLIYVTFKLTDNADSFRPFLFTGSPSNTVVWVAYFKLEKGNKPTDWTPSVEDINYDFNILNQSVTTKQDKTLFSALADKWIHFYDSATAKMKPIIKLVTGAINQLEFDGRMKLAALILSPNTSPNVANRLWSDGTNLYYDDSLAIPKKLAYTSDLPTTCIYTPTGDFTTTQLKTYAESIGLIFNGLHFIIKTNNSYTCTVDNGTLIPETVITFGKRGTGATRFEGTRTFYAGVDNVTVMSGNENTLAMLNFGTTRDLLTIYNTL